MKRLLSLIFLLLLIACIEKENSKIVEASCGQCQFGLTSKEGCDLAIKIDNKTYFVEGAHIDDYGDAHDETIGFCNAIRKVKITGNIEKDIFKVSSFTIIE